MSSRLQTITGLCLMVVMGTPSWSADAPASAPASQPALSATLGVRVAGPTLAGFPLQFTLTITNKGGPFSYWCGGPAVYPSARQFFVTVTDSKGQKKTLTLRNGQYEEGSGTDHPIKEKQELPASCDPLPAGTYTITFQGESGGYLEDGKMHETWPAMAADPITITITDDAKAHRAAENELMDQGDPAGKNDPFAHYLATVYGIDPDVKEWLETLRGDDAKAAWEVIGRLQNVRRLPVGGDKMVRDAAVKFSQRKEPVDPNLLRYISIIARHCRSDAALEAVKTIATSNIDESTREEAINDLAVFPQKQAETLLLELAKDKESKVYWAAIAGLARRHNVTALEPLLQAFKNQERRLFAVMELSGLHDQPAAREALNAALKDADQNIRFYAKQSLEGIGSVEQSTGEAEEDYWVN